MPQFFVLKARKLFVMVENSFKLILNNAPDRSILLRSCQCIRAFKLYNSNESSYDYAKFFNSGYKICLCKLILILNYLFNISKNKVPKNCFQILQENVTCV